MTPKMYFGGIAVVCATIVVSAALVAQEKPYQEMSPEEAAMMEAWNKYMTPGEHHERMAKRAGEWTVNCKIWQQPGTPPQEYPGTSRIKSVMDGRFFLEKFEGQVMDMPFRGLGIGGFDNMTQTYVGAWIDNMGTGIMRSEGTPSGDGKTIHFTTTHPDFMKGGYTKATIIEEVVNDDKFVATFYMTQPDGGQYKHMELIYTRK